MALEELRGGDESARPQLEDARNKFTGMRDAIDRGTGGAVREYDGTRDRDSA